MNDAHPAPAEPRPLFALLPDEGPPSAPGSGACADGPGASRDQNRPLLAIGRFDTPFLLTASLSDAVGSSDLTLDRGKGGKVKLAEFRRIAGRAVLVVLNKHQRATGGPAAVRAGAESFACSVVWTAPILREDDGAAVVDATGLALTDFHGVADHLREREQGTYDVDQAASFPLTEDSAMGARGLRLPALLTFRGLPEGDAVRRVVPVPGALSLVQHLNLVPLPRPSLPPRPYHPASGGYGIGHEDHGEGAAGGGRVMFQPRFRLEPVDPDRASGPVRDPIVFYVDPAVPEPLRTAVVEGGNWWRDAFERAGFQDAYRVEVAPGGLDLNDPAHNVVWWVHRDGRGWSHGQGLTDPRTGEIICGRVRLGSQRVEQVTALGESLLAPYGRGDEARRLAAVQELVLGRMRQLAAHEIGHALGFMHNFASTHHPEPSVMDYPHPGVVLADDGTIDLSGAYAEGLGPWDYFLVAHAYGRFPGEDEAAALARLRREARDSGLLYVTDDDARGPGAAHADAAVWVPHVPDPLEALDQALAVRRAALAGFSRAVLPPGRQTGELERRAAMLHLYHRHQLAGAARLVGGVRYAYGQAGDGGAAGAATSAVPAAVQWRALRRVAELLRAEHLALPASVRDVLTPPGIRYERSKEYLDTRAGRVFDPFSAAEAAAALVTEQLLEPVRLNRLAWQHAAHPDGPGVGDVVSALLDAAWPRMDAPARNPEARAVQEIAGWVVVRFLMAAVDAEELHPPVREAVRAALRALAAELSEAATAKEHETARTITAFLDAPDRAASLGPLPRIPPGAPI